MTMDKDPQKREENTGPDLSKFTPYNFERDKMKFPPNCKLYDYSELHMNVLSLNCYKSIPEQEIKTELYHEETLFYIFYTYTESDKQIAAYNLLIEKGYFYSTIYKCFIDIEGNKIIDNKNRKITIFDPFYWKKIEKTV
ncbi:putative transcriptional regulator, partial [Pseudoloma neurophilia]